VIASERRWKGRAYTLRSERKRGSAHTQNHDRKLSPKRFDPHCGETNTSSVANSQDKKRPRIKSSIQS